MGSRVRAPRRRAAAVAVAIAALVVVPAARATAAVGYGGFATGTILHADALQSGDTRVVDAEQGFSGAGVDSGGLAKTVFNEVQRAVVPAMAGKRSYARGSGVEAGLAQTPTTDNQVILAGKAEAAAPPTSQPVTKEVGPVKADPLVYASALRGQAAARWNVDSCVIGEDIARGVGYAVDAQVLNTGGVNADGTFQLPLVGVDAPGPERAVAQTRSRLTLVRQVAKNGSIVGPRFGLMSETRATIAPVTLFRGMPNQITLEFLGEWVLQAVATGVPGHAYVHYGPGTVDPETPILRTVDALGVVTNLLTTQQILTPAGLILKVPGVAEIAIGENARAIGGDDTSDPVVAANGTSASAAVDVVRVKLLATADLHAADIRVGHLEVSAHVPSGGIACAIPVAKVPTPASVIVGDGFTTAITVSNPFNCELKHVEVVDRVTVEGEARFHVTSTTPTADSAPGGDGLAEGTIAWDDIGTIAPHSSKTVKVGFVAQGGAGKIVDVATATGVIASCAGAGQTVAGVATAFAGAGVSGSTTKVEVPVTKVLGKKITAGPDLAATGVTDVVLPVVGLLVLALSLAIGRSMRRAG